MKVNLIFGTLEIPTNSTSSASLTVPGTYSQEMLSKLFVPIVQASKESREEDINEEVTHQVFFGENIQRVKNTLKK